MNEFIGFWSVGAINRLKLARSAQYLIDLGPMLQAGFVVMPPITVLFGPPKEIPYRASLNGFSDVYPKYSWTFIVNVDR